MKDKEYIEVEDLVIDEENDDDWGYAIELLRADEVIFHTIHLLESYIEGYEQNKGDAYSDGVVFGCELALKQLKQLVVKDTFN